MAEDGSAIKTALSDLLSAVVDTYDGFDVDPRIKAMAMRLCEWDGGDPKTVVMGYEQQHLAVAGRSKRLTCLQSPLMPLWAHYLSDATMAIQIVEEIKE